MYRSTEYKGDKKNEEDIEIKSQEGNKKRDLDRNNKKRDIKIEDKEKDKKGDKEKKNKKKYKKGDNINN